MASVYGRLRLRGRRSGLMIDQTVIEKLANAVILTFLMTACAGGPPATAPIPAETTEASESTATAIPAEDSTAESAGGQADGDASNDENDPSEESDEDASDEKKTKKPGRIVLKTVYDDQRVGEEQRWIIEAEMGLVEDEELLEYVRSVGIRLLRCSRWSSPRTNWQASSGTRSHTQQSATPPHG